MKQLVTASIKPGMVLAQDIYVMEDKTTAFLRKGAILNALTIERLRARGIRRMYIEDEETAAPALPPLLQEAKNQVGRRPSPVSPVLRRATLQTLEKLFESENDARELLARLTDLDAVIDQLVSALSADPRAPVGISELKSLSDFTYHHSLSVAVLAISVGHRLGLRGRQLNQLGLAAMMHDIGKASLPKEVYLKRGRLSANEYNIVKTHAPAGTSRLMEAKIGGETLWRNVLFHHERVDGNGYPSGLAGSRIPLFSRIIAVADVYDALTSARPHRGGMQPIDALEYVMGGADSQFDFDAVQGLVSKVELYPVGSCVRLSDGSLGLVLDTENPGRPVVEILGRGDVADLFRDRRYLNVVIVRAVPDSELFNLQVK